MKKIAIIFLSFALILSIFFIFTINSKYQELKNNIISSYFENHYYINNEEILDNSIIEKNGKILISYNTIKKYIDDEVTLSNSSTRVYFTLRNVEFNAGNTLVDRYIYDYLKSFNLPVIKANNNNYISYDMLSKFYKLRLLKYEKSSNVYVFTDGLKVAIIDKKTKITGRLDKSSITLDKLNTGEKVYLFNSKINENNEYNIIDKNGYLGYIKSENINSINSVDMSIVKKSDRIKKQSNLETVNVMWDQVGSYSKNKNLTDTNYLKGINIISPTWFKINVDGIVLNEASLDYVNRVHSDKKMVWALFSNSFNKDWTSKMFTNEEFKKNTIAQILFYSSVYNLDGINIDFENMNLSDKANFVEFTKELGALLDEYKVYSSLDVTVPGGSDAYSKVLDRKKLSENVDYIMLMAYDEFWASSKVAGSVASANWTEKGIVGTLEEVDTSKLVLGIPLYTRIWEETKLKSGKKVAKSSTLSVKNSSKYITDNNIDIKYDKVSQQNYGEYYKNDKLNRIWFEDSKSFDMRKNLKSKYNLKGYGFWSIEFIDENTWNEIYKIIE
ncbi:glycosyl hydrolase family 18 protein [Helicovermis profundi]|uniref:GH18 domain-containing protein n=1 Tax=Helicovermis profundi TaxID=3065157 RepID=A0AAU9EKI1_9FIRM|nr:hypothetical protein HLPR_08150 [Clostridia bacterium S502]